MRCASWCRPGDSSGQEWEGRYLYCAAERARRQEQWAARQVQRAAGDDLQAAQALFYSLLDEQQRRLYAGLESLQLGYGGQQHAAERFGLDVDTVARGERELLTGQVVRGRVRRPGGGRRRGKKTPGILNRLRALLQDDTAGDPMGRRGVWTGKRLRAISRELAQLGLRVCPNTVRRLLGKLDYALHANRKSLCARRPERDEQFTYLTYQRQQFRQAGYPIISVDSKKKELVGQFKNPAGCGVGRRFWSRTTTSVRKPKVWPTPMGFTTCGPIGPW